MRPSTALSMTRLSPDSLPRWAGPGEKLYEYLRRGKKKRSRRRGRRVQASPISKRVFIDFPPPGRQPAD